MSRVVKQGVYRSDHIPEQPLHFCGHNDHFIGASARLDRSTERLIRAIWMCSLYLNRDYRFQYEYARFVYHGSFDVSNTRFGSALGIQEGAYSAMKMLRDQETGKPPARGHKASLAVYFEVWLPV